jgi:hypothetical protein
VASQLIREQFIWFYHIHRPNGEAQMHLVASAFQKVFDRIDDLMNYQPADTGTTYKW